MAQNFSPSALKIRAWMRGAAFCSAGRERNFEAVSGPRSGIRIYGEQRGAAVADFDQDGRRIWPSPKTARHETFPQHRRAARLACAIDWAVRHPDGMAR